MKRWAVLCGAAIVVILVLADTDHLGILGLLERVPYGDKVAHIAVFGLLSLLVNLAVFEGWPKLGRRWLAVRASLALAILIGLEEWSQRLFPTRHASVWDLLASYLGVAACAWIALQIAKRRASSEIKQ